MKNFIIRLLTGILYVGIVTFCVLRGPYTFLALFLIIVSFCLREFYRLVNKHKATDINPYLHGAGGALLFLVFFLYSSGICDRPVISCYLIYMAITLIYELYTGRKDPVTRLAYIFFGQCYIAVPLSILNFIAFPSLQTNPHIYQWTWIFALFLFIWANDTGAYIVGVRFGKHKLWERISPRKSWEGFFGGLVFTVVSAFVFAHLNHQVVWYHWVFISIGVVIFSTYGDLIESLIKREFAIKDSGNSLPGHGGLLDRFDSLLLAVYVIVIYTNFLFY